MSAFNVSDTTGSLLLLNAGVVDLQHAVDTCWLLVCAYLVFIMQLGFALLEAGSVRAINTKNIIMQNILDTCISIIMWWLTGFGISQGYYSGGVGDMKQSATRDPSQFALFIFLWVGHTEQQYHFTSCCTVYWLKLAASDYHYYHITSSPVTYRWLLLTFDSCC